MTLQKQKKQVISKDSFHYKHFKKKKSHHYLKPYYPYLPILALILLGTIVLISVNKIGGQPTNLSSNSLIGSANKIRLKDGLASINLNSNLSKIAQDSANQIAGGYQTKIEVSSLAEGFNNSSEVIGAWMSNQMTKSELLNTNLRNVGFGIAQDFHQTAKYVVVAVYQSTSGNVSHITFYVPPSQNSQKNSPSNNFSDQKLISRIVLITSNPLYQEMIIVVLALLATIFFLRHLIFFKKVLVEGEKIILNNVWLDVVIIITVFIGIYLLQTVGFIS